MSVNTCILHQSWAHRHTQVKEYVSCTLCSRYFWFLVSFQLLDIFTFITPVRDAFESTHFLSLTLTWIYPLSWANRRQVGSHLWAWLPGNKEGESKRESECVRKRGTWWQRKNSHVVAKRRGEIWERWFNCLSQIACHSRSTGAALELAEFIMQPKCLKPDFVLCITRLASG